MAVFTKVEESSHAKKIMEDINYSYNFYQNTTFGKTTESFGAEKWCCETSLAADSNFKEDENKRMFNSKTFLAPKSNIVTVTIRSDNTARKFLDFDYKVSGNISVDLCQRMLSTYIEEMNMVSIHKNKKEEKYAKNHKEGYNGVMFMNRKDIPEICSGKVSSVEIFLS